DVVLSNYASGKQTFIIPLTFPNIPDAKDIITRIGYGGDVWEMRVDLLSPDPKPLGDVNTPPLDYVKDQVQALQAMSSLPILFTIRTRSQGGKFPDTAEKEALDLLHLAIELEIAYIDVEIEWSKELIRDVSTKKGSTRAVASYHNWTGKVSWASQELMDKFDAANSFGDIVKLSIRSADIEACYKLALFARNHRRRGGKPLLAVGMGPNGQLSRITSQISLVTHPLIPFPSAPGQLGLAQVHQGRHLIGQLLKKRIGVSGDSAVAEKVVRGLQAAFIELGYPH
ncbi:3-dehydroquinate dehydratase type I, partial [Thelonectria olida]